MRRLFHGRMVSVDGHCRRMEVNYDKYAIAVNNNIGYPLLNQSRTDNQIGSHLKWSTNLQRLSTIVPIKQGHEYYISLTKPGYEIFFAFYDKNLILKDNGDWQDEIVTIPGDTDYILLQIRNKTNPDAYINVGEVGLILEDDGED